MWICRSQGCEPFRSLGSWEGWGDVGSGLSLLHSVPSFALLQGDLNLAINSSLPVLCSCFLKPRIEIKMIQTSRANFPGVFRKSLTLFVVKREDWLGEQNHLKITSCLDKNGKTIATFCICTSTLPTMPHGQ